MEQESVTIFQVIFDNFLITRPATGQTQFIVTDSFLLVSVLLTLGYFWAKKIFIKKAK